MDLVLAQLFQRRHREPNVVEVLDRPAEAFGDVVEHLEELVHVAAVLGVAVAAVAQKPGLRLRAQPDFQLGCRRSEAIIIN